MRVLNLASELNLNRRVDGLLVGFLGCGGYNDYVFFFVNDDVGLIIELKVSEVGLESEFADDCNGISVGLTGDIA